jgi:hypothetical protein
MMMWMSVDRRSATAVRDLGVADLTTVSTARIFFLFAEIARE